MWKTLLLDKARQYPALPPSARLFIYETCSLHYTCAIVSRKSKATHIHRPSLGGKTTCRDGHEGGAGTSDALSYVPLVTERERRTQRQPQSSSSAPSADQAAACWTRTGGSGRLASASAARRAARCRFVSTSTRWGICAEVGTRAARRCEHERAHRTLLRPSQAPI